jgi:chromosome partitioning protein
MRTVAITNQKGGSCKTTTAVNLAAALGEKGRRVLVVDLDPQASASSWLGVKDGGKGLYELFLNGGSITDLVNVTDVKNVSVIPSSEWLGGVARQLAGDVGAETLFRQRLSRLPKDRWDLVLVDCPPTLEFLVLSALVACHEILVPVECHVLALKGLASLVQTVEKVKDRLNKDLALTAILPCRMDARTNLSRDVVARLRERFGDLVMKTVIRENVRLAEAPSFAKPITLYDTESAGAEDYRAAATELLKTKTRSAP